ncbi:LysE family transporter [Devosia sp.]|uniref:LysE family translocator n=1 Tax=Devosia sp. TaxID=1871048 RepID=UPI0032675763
MIDLLPFVLAVLGLLIVPGPTNTLMAAAGAARGVQRSLPLLAGELGGYLIAITVWTELVGAAGTSQPWIGTAAKLIAAAFLLWSAWKLWTSKPASDTAAPGITLGRVFLTTLLNPKALVFAFAIFPHVSFVARLPYLGVFGVLVVATAVAWQSLGAAAALSSRGLLTAKRVEQVSAVALSVFAVLLIGQTLQSWH